MVKLIPTLELLNSLDNPVLFTVTDGVIIISKSRNSEEAYDALHDLLHDSDITYVWRENSIVVNPEMQ